MSIKDNSSQSNLKELINSIPEWDPKQYFKYYMEKWNGFSCVISGSSRSGKSNMLKYLLCHKGIGIKKYFDLIVIFSRTLCNGFYSGFINSKLMFDKFNPEIIEDLKKTFNEHKKKGKTFKTLFIFDDIVSQKSKFDEDITSLFYNGRHFNFSIFYLTQKCSLTSTGWIANCTLFISLFAGSRNEKEYLSEKVIADCIDTDLNKSKKQIERDAYMLQNIICQDYRALIICPYDNEKVFWYKAKVIKYNNNKQIQSIYEKFIKN